MAGAEGLTQPAIHGDVGHPVDALGHHRGQTPTPELATLVRLARPAAERSNALDPLGMLGAQRQRQRTAEAQADHRAALDAELVPQRQHTVQDVGETTVGRRLRTVTMAPGIEAQHAELAGQRLGLLRPEAGIVADAGNEGQPGRA
ncbi:hypothetical protein D3C78_1456330 [compost metagenome]